jgi:biotin carboxylase
MAPVNTAPILLLGAGPYYQTCIAATRALGYHVICIDRDPNAAGQKAANEFYSIDFSQKEAVLDFAQSRSIQAIVPLNDYGVPTAAFVSQRLGLPGITETAARQVTDKYAMRQAWDAAGLPNPRFQLVENLAQAQQAAQAIGFPVIFKPANSLGGGSRGVQTAHHPEEVPSAYQFASSVYAGDARVLVEACVQGVEHSAEVVVIDQVPYVVAISDKVKTPYPYRVDEQVVYPTAIQGPALSTLKQTIVEAVRAVGITVGAAHVELCSTADGPVLFEIGARCGGGATADPIVASVAQYPYFQTVIQLLSGESPAPPDPQTVPRPCIYGFFTVENQHRFRGADPALFLELEWFEKDPLPAQTRQGGDRLGYYIYNGTPADLDARLGAVVS